MKNSRDRGQSGGNKLLFVILVLAVIAATLLAEFYFINGDSEINQDNGKPSEKTGIYTKYTNENFGLSFPYPSSWNLNTRVVSNVLFISINESPTLRNSRAKVRIFVDPVSSSSLDNIERQLTETVENDENMSIVGEIERFTVDGNQGIDYSYMSYGENYDVRSRAWIIRGEKFSYDVYYSARENFYEESHTRLDSIIENFAIK